MKRERYILALMIILFTAFVSAEMTLSNPLETYNLGDRLYISADGIIGSEYGNLNIDLACKNKTVNLVKIPARSFSLEDEQSYSTHKTLNRQDLEMQNLSSIIGECQLIASLGNKKTSTKTFTISNEIIINVNLDQYSYNPGEDIKITTLSTKSNGNLVNGFIKISNATQIEKAVIKGEAKEIFSLPETTESGIYKLDIFVYDVDSSGTLNTGRSILEFKINQIASSIIMSASSESVTPGDSLKIGAELFDQSGVSMPGNVKITLESPNKEIRETVVKSGETVSIDFEKNATPGIWKTTSIFNNLIQERTITVEELQLVDFEIDGSVLTIRNIGNTIYNKTIDLKIGEDIKTLKLNIKSGETRKFNLAAPNGEYEILVDDGQTSLNKNVLLTGNAISIKGLKEGINYSFLWILLVIALGAAGFVIFTKKKKGTGERAIKLFKKVKDKIPKKIKSQIDNSLHFTNKSPKVQSLDESNYHHEDPSMIDLTKSKIKQAESSLTIKGEKHNSTIISINLKNNEEITDIAKEALNKIIVSSQGKGLVDWRSNYIFLVFSPLVTRTYQNEILAIKSADEINKKLKDYNKRFKDKIEYGIGINSGEMIATKKDGKFKYTGIGNTISFAKRIADSENKKVLMSDSIRKKLLRDLKVTHGKEIGESKTYELLEIKDRSRDAKKLDELMKRMK